MPVSPTYPGVYVQEVPSGVRTIVGVSTSVALFIGRTKSGPMNDPVRITTYSDFIRTFGEDHTISDVARYVKLFFLNGGADCYVMRIARNSASSTVTLENEAGQDALVLTAKNPGTLGDSIRAAVTYNGQYPEATFNMEIFRWETNSAGNRTKVAREEWKNLSMDPAASTYAPTFLSQKSSLVNATDPAVAPIQDGTSLSGRAIPDDATEAGFRAAWNSVLGNGATARHKFQISVDGNRYVEVNLALPTPLDIGAMPGGGSLGQIKTDLGAEIAVRIGNALAAAGIPFVAPAVDVTFPTGPTGVGGGGETTYLQIASRNKKDIRIQSSSDAARDLAAASFSAPSTATGLMLGEANGGTEVGAYAQRRPAPTGISLKASDLASMNAFNGLLQSALDQVTLDENDTSNPPLLVPANITFDLETTGDATARMWTDAAGISSFRGTREKLAIIRDAVNAYQAANSSRFFWRAELWGSRLAFYKTGGDDTQTITTFATSATNLASPTSRFTVNSRYYSLGPAGTAGLQNSGGAGADGAEPGGADYDAAYVIAESKIDLFNLLVLPPDNGAAATPLEQLWPNASAFCMKQRAFLIMDCPDGWTTSQLATTGVDALRVGLVKGYSAIYFPRLTMVENGLSVTVGAAGAMAGLYARIDSSRGVWKAPAGTEADVRGVSGVDLRLSDAENGQFNPVGVNAIRLFPEGVVSWGARTMDGSDVFASDYKYIPVRRTALFIEESLYRGLRWVVFEPNDDALYAQIRLNVGAFMQDLFRKGAFFGIKPSEAYFVKCDRETTTQNDRNLGIVNIWVGFAPLKPAEFVVLYLQQMAGQIEG
ncbi:phage tail sheath family protein [Sorangium sp. So ce1097]|uniref:phage tail sheath family protein n=1 Tax=Sorangium sp. So ce1097 TaxID=3133330 RepID=UPI003F635875